MGETNVTDPELTLVWFIPTGCALPVETATHAGGLGQLPGSTIGPHDVVVLVPGTTNNTCAEPVAVAPTPHPDIGSATRDPPDALPSRRRF